MTTDRIPVHLVGFPLRTYRVALEHNKELIREFSLIALSTVGDDPHPTVPARLLDLVDTVTRDFAGITDATDARRDEALEAGLEPIDLTYIVPPSTADASRRLAAILDEADEFCRSGDALLTLATPPEAKLFRDWYLDEFIRQLSGAAPTPWPQYAAAAQVRR